MKMSAPFSPKPLDGNMTYSFPFDCFNDESMIGSDG